MPEAQKNEAPIRIFVSYAREDRKWLDLQYPFHLLPYLEDSLRRLNVTFWYDHAILPGDEYKRLIEAEIDKARIALLLVSQSFLNSEFIEEYEMPRIHERARMGEMIVVPVLVGPCKWGDYPFLADRQMVASGNPLIKHTQNEAQWEDARFDVLEGLREQVKRIREAAAQRRETEEASAAAAARKAEEQAEAARVAEAEEQARQSAEVAEQAAREQAEAERLRQQQDHLQRAAEKQAADEALHRKAREAEEARQSQATLKSDQSQDEKAPRSRESTPPQEPPVLKTSDMGAPEEPAVTATPRWAWAGVVLGAIGVAVSIASFFSLHRQIDSDCQKGSALACTQLGDYYYDGKGKDEPQALQKAAAAYSRVSDSSSNASDRLGHMYMWGLGVNFDPVRAKDAFWTDCTNFQDSDGCAYWALLYIHLGPSGSVGLDQVGDPPTDHEWGYVVARCNKGEAESCAAIAAVYEYRSKDLPSAVTFYEKACAQTQPVLFACKAADRLKSLVPQHTPKLLPDDRGTAGGSSP